MKVFQALLNNSRFWILAIGITASVLIIGFVQFLIPAGSLQSIRIEQIDGFISFVLLYLAVLASPFTKVFPNFPFNKAYLHARRAIGVLSFYYAFLHVDVSFFSQLNGFSGVAFLNKTFDISLTLGVIALAILAILTLTSLDWAVKVMHFKNWKLLQRLVYIAGIAILVHVTLVGAHFTELTVIGVITYLLMAFLVVLEILRVRLYRKSKP